METQILERLNTIEQKLDSLQTQSKEVLNFIEAAQFLNVSRSHLYKLTSSNQIPHYKPRGKQVYFDKKELENWLLQNRAMSKDEIDQAANDFVTGKKRGAK